MTTTTHPSAVDRLAAALDACIETHLAARRCRQGVPGSTGGHPMTEDTDAQALGMRPADDPAGARAGVPGPTDGRHADVVTLRDALFFDVCAVTPEQAEARGMTFSLRFGAALNALIAAVRADATRAAEAEVAAWRRLAAAHCGSACSDEAHGRLLHGYRALAAQPAAPEEVCGCGVLWNAAIHSEQYDPEVADFHAPYPPDQPAAPCRCNVGSCFTHPHNPGCAPHGHTVQPAAPEAEPERCCHGYRAPR